MESAAKRKAASAAVGDSDGRPTKRQKVPVRAACIGGDCIAGGGLETWRGVGSDAGWLLDKKRATPGGSTSMPIASAGPSMSPQHHTRRRRCIRILGRDHVQNFGERALTMDRLRAGRIERQLGDGRVDYDAGLKVPRKLEASQRQDVRARPNY